MKKLDWILPTFVLTLICLIAAAALAYTNAITQPLILQAEIDAANAARVVVLPEGDSFTKIEAVTTENVTEMYSADNGAGYVVTSIAKGYGGDIRVMVGINTEGIITGTKLMAHNETPGLGARVGLEGEGTYSSQYVGKTSSLEDVTAISGATISSGAYRSAVETAFTAYGDVAGVEVEPSGPADPRETLFPGVELTPITLEGAKEAYRAANEGYLIITTALGYYDTDMEVAVAVGPDGVILGVGLGENGETKGVGQQVGAADYTERYRGKDAETYADVDAVTGATVSSDAFKRGVKKAMALVTPDLLAALNEEVPAA